jgi:hypothetical protein
MNPIESPDPLEELLRAESKYIEDAGFTGRVVGALPSGNSARMRMMLPLGVTVIGMAVFVSLAPGMVSMIFSWTDWSASIQSAYALDFQTVSILIAGVALIASQIGAIFVLTEE